MGQTTPNLQIWTPDRDDLNEPDVYLATMAASIENGTGERLKLQEIAVGLKVSLNGNQWQIPSGNNATTVVPYTVTPNRGDFNQGFTFASGTATVQTSGMYLLTASIGPAADTSAGGKGVKIIVEKNGLFVAGNELPGAVAWIGSSVSVVVNCVTGDTLRAKATITGATGTTPNNDNSSYMSIAMIQAVPQ